jgi:hypothetical protein
MGDTAPADFWLRFHAGWSEIESVRRSFIVKSLHSRLMAGLSVASLLAASSSALAAPASAGDADGLPQLLTELQFKSATQMLSTIARTSMTSATQASLTSEISAPGWIIGAQNGGSIGVQATTGPDGTTVDALEGSYPAGNAGNTMWASYSVASLRTEDVYIDFWAKMPGATGGCKFLKIFGVRSATGGFANTTFGPDYTGIDPGALLQVIFGDGTNLLNDGQNAIKLSGLYPNMIGRSYGTAVVRTPQMEGFSSADWGTGWHHFLVHVKFNSGTTAQNEVPDGEVFLEIDGKVYVDATGLYNRNPANGPIDNVELFGWAQNNPSPFQVWFYDVRISTGGFTSQGSQQLPDPPVHVGVK